MVECGERNSVIFGCLRNSPLATCPQWLNSCLTIAGLFTASVIAGLSSLDGTDYLLFFGVQTLGAGVTQDEGTSLEQIGFLLSYCCLN